LEREGEKTVSGEKRDRGEQSVITREGGTTIGRIPEIRKEGHKL